MGAREGFGVGVGLTFVNDTNAPYIYVLKASKVVESDRRGRGPTYLAWIVVRASGRDFEFDSSHHVHRSSAERCCVHK